MSDSNEFTDNTLIKVTGTAIVGVVAAAARSYGMPDEAVLGALTIAPSMIDIVTEAHQRRAKVRSEALTIGIASAFEGDPQRAYAAVEEAANDDSNTVMFTTYRNMMDAIDDAVVPALGRLAGEYIEAKKPADAFFRGFGRMLCELTAAALEELRICLTIAAALRDERVPLRLAGVRSEPYQIGESGVRLGGFKHAGQIFHLLRAHGFAIEPVQRPGVFASGGKGPALPWTTMSREAAAHMLRIIGGSGSGVR